MRLKLEATIMKRQSIGENIIILETLTGNTKVVFATSFTFPLYYYVATRIRTTVNKINMPI